MDAFVQASPEEIAVFKKAAAERYAERGIDPDKADELFNGQINNVSAQLQSEATEEEKLTDKVARIPLIDKIATQLATSLGRKRPAKTQA